MLWLCHPQDLWQSKNMNQETIYITDSAVARILYLGEKEGAKKRFRIGVGGGGCSGFQYDFSLDDKPIAASDIVIAKNGAEVVIDDISFGLVKGATLDYTEDLAHAGFEIKNPNATASCGCGNSFSVAL